MTRDFSQIERAVIVGVLPREAASGILDNLAEAYLHLLHCGGVQAEAARVNLCEATRLLTPLLDEALLTPTQRHLREYAQLAGRKP